MKRILLSASGLFFTFASFAQITYTKDSVAVTCAGGNDGKAIITSISNGATFNTSTKGLLISEIYTDHTSNDSPFELVTFPVTIFAKGVTV